MGIIVVFSGWLLVGRGLLISRGLLGVGLCLGLRLRFYRHNWLRVCSYRLRLGNCLVHLSIVLLECAFKQEVSGVLFVLIASEVCFSGFLLGESKRLETFNGLHLVLAHLHNIAWLARLARSASTSSSATGTWHASSCILASWEAEVGVASEYSVHESSLVRLNRVVQSRVFLLGSLDEIRVEARILTHSLCHKSEVL